MIDPNRLRDVASFLDYGATDLAPRLFAFKKSLVKAGFSEDHAMELTIALLQSVLAVPSPVEGGR